MGPLPRIIPLASQARAPVSDPAPPPLPALGLTDEDFAACPDIAAVGQRFAAIIRPFGFTVSAAGAFVPTNTGPESHFFFQNWPSDWIELYTRRNFLAADFGVAEARRRLAPFLWSEALAERQLSRAEAELWQTAKEWGWEDGLSVPIHGPGGYFALTTMGGAGFTMTPQLRAAMHRLAFAAHERCRHLAGAALVAPAPASLTGRELECLRWVASGKTDWEIAQILGVAATTVKTHVDQARVELNARTRPQAVARMVLSGLI